MMDETEQTEGLSVLDHGVNVAYYCKMIIGFLRGHNDGSKLKIPEWLCDETNKKIILKKLLPYYQILEYATYHDCGKPLCLKIDKNGKRHFPNHSEISANVYSGISKNKDVIELIRHDMDIHTMSADQIPQWKDSKYAATLLVSGLAEIHSNSKMFGGVESTNFKIKWKQIDRRGKSLMSLWREDVQRTNDEKN